MGCTNCGIWFSTLTSPRLHRRYNLGDKHMGGDGGSEAVGTYFLGLCVLFFDILLLLYKRLPFSPNLVTSISEEVGIDG